MATRAAVPKGIRRKPAMINRRTFLAVSSAAGLAPMGGLVAAAAEPAQGGRDYYVLQQYQVENESQKQRLDGYLRDAAIPALNRLGVQPVGVFYPDTDPSPIYVLLRHKSPEVLLSLVDQLLADPQFAQKGTDVLDANNTSPPFKREETSLMLALKGVPKLETPIKSPGRVFQLRIYEQPSIKAAKKKIEMFNDAGELELFRRVGLNPVFFGETLIGSKMPNLTYMLAFNSRDEQQANWKKFLADPKWKELKTMPEYMDKTIMCGVTNLLLKPADYSQV
jgi:hypothetical protein